MNKQTTTNPFDFGVATEGTQSGIRKIEFTSQLVALSNSRASECIRETSKRPELLELANRVLDDGQAVDVFELLETVIGKDVISDDAQFMADGSPDVLDRLLESRRSDRSKTKAKGLRKSMDICLNYFSAAYAELLVRSAMKKPYEATGNDLDETDKDAISRKVKSLQSKQSRLSQIAKYDPSKQAELDAVKDEIARLNNLRGTSVKTSTAIKSSDLTAMRETLKQVDTSGLSEEDKAKFEVLMSKLG